MPPKFKPLKVRISEAYRLETRLMSSGPKRDPNYITSHSGNGSSKIIHLPDPPLKRPASPPPDSSKKSRRKKAYQSQGASVYMQRFMEIESKITSALLSMESSVNLNEPCPCGRTDSVCDTRCMDCFHCLPTCSSCFIETHVRSPLHWAEQYDSALGFFQRKDISEIGHVITLGHDGGLCPKVGYENPASSIAMTIMHVNGLHSTRVVFCRCGTSQPDRVEQLLAARLFPATVDLPETAFTFECLDDFQIHSLTSKKSALDYVWAKRRQTNPLSPFTVKNPIKAFIRASRVWRVHDIKKFSGQEHGIDKHFPFRPAGNVMQPCLVCPIPGFNTPEEWDPNKEDWNNDFDHLATLFLSEDGHFGLQRKTKPDDQDDISLLDGRGLFPVEEKYQETLREYVSTSPEKSTCSKFNAIELQNKLKFKGSVVTGVVGGMCARHSTFLAMVDLYLGERYINSDYVLWMMLTILSHSLLGAKFIRRVVLTYDIACQFSIHIRERFAKLPFSETPSIGDLVDMIVFLVPKLHLDGHKSDCKYRWSLNYTKCCCRTDGEGIERAWADNKQMGSSSKEMNHGHRHEVLIGLFNDWNRMKMANMSTYLSTQLKKGIKARDRKISEYVEASKRAGRKHVADWSKESTEPFEIKKGVWTSVYRYRESERSTQEAAYVILTEQWEERAAKSDARVVGALPSFVNKALKIEQIQRALHRKVEAAEISVATLGKERAQLRKSVTAFRELQIVICPALQNIIKYIPFHNPETEPLFLPSHFSKESRSTYCLDELAEIEFDLRKGQAYDAIQDLKSSIQYMKGALHVKAKNSGSQKRNTRSTIYICKIRDNKDVWAAKYRRARECLLALGADPAHFRPLNDDDMFLRNIRDDAALGEGSTDPGWIWSARWHRDETHADAAAHEVENRRVNWHRSKADALRHIEEVELLEEEFRRYIRASRALYTIWTTLGSDPGSSCGDNPLPSDSNTTPGASAVVFTSPTSSTIGGSRAYAKKRAYWYLRLGEEAERQFKLLGGSWPEEGQSLISYLRARRPSLEVDWEALEKERMEDILLAENSMQNRIKTGEMDKFVESLEDEGEEESSDEEDDE